MRLSALAIIAMCTTGCLVDHEAERLREKNAYENAVIPMWASSLGLSVKRASCMEMHTRDNGWHMQCSVVFSDGTLMNVQCRNSNCVVAR